MRALYILILPIIAYIVLAAISPIVIIDHHVGLLRHGTVYFQNKTAPLNAYSKYTYIAYNGIGVHTNNQLLPIVQTLRKYSTGACYIEIEDEEENENNTKSTITACWSGNNGAAVMNSTFLVHTMGKMIIVWPGTGVVITNEENLISPSILQWRQLHRTKYILPNGNTVTVRKNTFILKNQTYVFTKTSIRVPSNESIGIIITNNIQNVEDDGTLVLIPVHNIALAHEILLIKDHHTNNWALKQLVEHDGDGTYVFLPTNITTGIAAFIYGHTVYVSSTSVYKYNAIDDFLAEHTYKGVAFVLYLHNYMVTSITYYPFSYIITITLPNGEVTVGGNPNINITSLRFYYVILHRHKYIVISSISGFTVSNAYTTTTKGGAIIVYPYGYWMIIYNDEGTYAIAPHPREEISATLNDRLLSFYEQNDKNLIPFNDENDVFGVDEGDEGVPVDEGSGEGVDEGGVDAGDGGDGVAAGGGDDG